MLSEQPAEATDMMRQPRQEITLNITKQQMKTFCSLAGAVAAGLVASDERRPISVSRCVRTDERTAVFLGIIHGKNLSHP